MMLLGIKCHKYENLYNIYIYHMWNNVIKKIITRSTPEYIDDCERTPLDS